MELTLKHIKESECLTDLSQCFCTNLKALNMPWGKSQTTPLKAPLGLVTIDVGGVTEDTEYNSGH